MPLLSRLLRGCLLAAPLFLLTATAQADVRLPSIIGDHMVLQRGKMVPIWGWDDPNTQVTVSLAGKSMQTMSSGEGRWMVMFPAMEAGGPHQLTIEGTSSVTVDDVLVGEVWLCSGQSNMEWPVSASDNPQEEIAAANHPRLRHIKIPHRPSDKPEEDVPSDGWKVCTPENVPGFTAVGYYFGRELLQQLDVPVGLIGSNWGGTRIEPWTPPVGFQSVPALEDIAKNLDNFPSKRNDGAINHQTPLALYNGMIHPLMPYEIRGAIWYQGESNNGEGMLYRDKMEALITGWRKVWNDPDMPFYFVQLAPFKYGGEPDRLAGIWEAQLKALEIPHTGMAVTVDIGNTSDIHPRNKQDVGKRLALWALTKDYQKDVGAYSGPLYKGMEVEGKKVRLKFDHVGDGLISRDGKPLSWFTIAGEDQKFVEAQAEIDGDSVVVWADSVEKPVAVRLGWDQLAEPNLSNKAGLPASPFRTDSW